MESTSKSALWLVALITVMGLTVSACGQTGSADEGQVNGQAAASESRDNPDDADGNDDADDGNDNADDGNDDSSDDGTEDQDDADDRGDDDARDDDGYDD